MNTKNDIIELLKAEAKKYQTDARYAHTLGVYTECRKLANVFGLEENDALELQKAALLHDITKDMSGKKQIELCLRYGITPPPKATAPMPTVHQDTGAFFTREALGKEIVTDVVFSAISSHTTGKADMSNIDKLLFIADYIEPTRKYKSCSDTREYLYRECAKINKNDKAALYRLLAKTVVDVIGYTVDYLISKRRIIDHRMILAWNSLL